VDVTDEEPAPGGLAGRLLVATPSLLDPNFHQTVVLLLEHTDEEALGLVLNRPGSLSVAEPLPAWVDLVTEPALLFVGGPVQPEAVLGLGRVRQDFAGEELRLVVGRVGVVDLTREESRADLEAVRLFAGYAGWGGGQLESELMLQAWFVVDAEAGDVFDADPDSLWRRVLGRQDGPLAQLANYPKDPRLN
jgi:putative transcriptional regulator